MFGLIPIVVAIILGGVITGMVAYISGNVFSDSTEEAAARKAINEGEHLITAIKLYQFESRTKGGDVETLLESVKDNSTYFKGGSLEWKSDEKGLFTSVEGGACELVNIDLGYEGDVPECGNIPPELSSKKYYCCTNP